MNPGVVAAVDVDGFRHQSYSTDESTIVDEKRSSKYVDAVRLSQREITGSVYAVFLLNRGTAWLIDVKSIYFHCVLFNCSVTDHEGD